MFTLSELRVAVAYGALTGETLNKHYHSFYTPHPVIMTDEISFDTTPLNVANCSHPAVTCVREPEECDNR